MNGKKRWWSTTRGHPIYSEKQGVWKYADNDELVDHEKPRACKRCGRYPTKEGHDACLGMIPGVKNACCGHGIEDPYVHTTSDIVSRAQGMYTSRYKLHQLREMQPMRIFEDDSLVAVGENVVIIDANPDTKMYLCGTRNAVEWQYPYCYDQKNRTDSRFSDSMPHTRADELNQQFVHYATLRRSGFDFNPYEVCNFRIPNLAEGLRLGDCYHRLGVKTNGFWTSEQWGNVAPWIIDRGSDLDYYPYQALTRDCMDVQLVFNVPWNHQWLLNAFNEVLDLYYDEHFHCITFDELLHDTEEDPK